MSSKDFELKLERVLKITLFLWLYPYIIWFFARRIWKRVREWITEPEVEPKDGDMTSA